MYIVYEYSLLAFGLFFFGIIGFWKRDRKYKEKTMTFYESRNPKESFLLIYFSQILTWIFLGGLAGYSFFFMVLRFHLRNQKVILKAFNIISSNFAFTGKMLREAEIVLVQVGIVSTMIFKSLLLFMLVFAIFQ